MKIAITSGKGGTGKSTLATSLAYALAKNKRVLLIDCDVDCSSDHLLLNLKLKKAKEVENKIPIIGKIPYRKDFVHAMIKMKPVVEINPKYKKMFKDIIDKINKN